MDSYDNGNRGGIGSECLYVRKLIVTAGSTLNLGGANLYYLEAQIDGSVTSGTPTQILPATDINDNGLVYIGDVRIIANNWLLTGCSCPDFCNGADVNLDGRVDLQDLALVAMDWLEREPGIFWSETFDSDPSWTTEGEWAFGTPTGSGGSSNGNPDPTSGYTGSNVYGINLSGDYNTTVTGGYHYLTSPSIDCTGCSNTELRFRRWLNVDAPGWVPVNVEVRYDGGSWVQKWHSSIETGGDITDSGWSQKTIDISPSIPSTTVQIRWGHEVKLAGAYEYSGWNIDDVELWEVPTP
jgi:hypothetical protein